MKFHHVGIACRSIEAGLETLRRTYHVSRVLGPVHDPHQDATVCLAITTDGVSLELVAGPRVEGLLKRGVQLYHTCFAVEDLDAELARLVTSGAMVVGPPAPAPLFDGARVAFVATPLGLVELLEQPER